MKERERNGENGKNEAGKGSGWTSTSAGAGEAEPTALWKADGWPQKSLPAKPHQPSKGPNQNWAVDLNRKTNRAKWKHVGCLPLPSPALAMALCICWPLRRPLGKQGTAFVTLLLSVPPIPQPLPTKSHRLSSVQDVVVVRGQGSWALGSWEWALIPCPWPGEKQQDALVADRREEWGQSFTLSDTRIGFLNNQPNACPACVGAEKAGERGRVQTSVRKRGTLNTHG